MSQDRRPSGTPAGGQFSASDHAEADTVTLAAATVDPEALARMRREDMHHDRELAALELEFEMSGGRGVHLAEQIDEIRRRYAEPIEGAVKGTAGSWTAEAAFYDRPVAGIIYDYESDPLHPDTMLEEGEAGPDRGDPLLVVWNDDGDVTDEGPRSVSLRSIPGVNEILAGASDVPVSVETSDDGQGGLYATFALEGVQVAEVSMREGSPRATIKVFGPDGKVVAIDGEDERAFDVVPPRNPWKPA